MSFTCAYCKKSFVKENTLSKHVCERKRRFQQEKEIGVQWGLQAYVMFVTTTQKTRCPGYEDFVNSNYYTAFVKYGRYCHALHCVNFAKFTEFLLKTNRRLDNWCNDNIYNEWLTEYLRRENVQDALERSITTMVDYTHNHPEYRNGYRDYFALVNENRVCYHITTGRISPWIVYQSQSGRDFLDRLNDDQAGSVMHIIDPTYWQLRFCDCPEDVQFANRVLKLADL